MLTIAIPTYNREASLRETLQSLVEQDCAEVSEIIVIDNNSDYDVHALIEELAYGKIRLHRNQFNVGMGMNLVMPFLLARTDWLWCLSDDDLPCARAVERVKRSVVNCASNVGMIKFSRTDHIQGHSIVKNLPSLIEHYKEGAPDIGGGDLLFFSTTVVNIKRLGYFVESTFEYNFTHIGFLCPIIRALDAQACHLEMSSEVVVDYCGPEIPWSYHKVGRGLATFSLLPLQLRTAERRALYKLIMQVQPHMLLRTEYVKKQSIGVGEMLYYYFSMFRYTLNVFEKVAFFASAFVLSPICVRKIIARAYIKEKSNEIT